MTSQAHEIIVDDIREIVSRDYVPLYDFPLAGIVVDAPLAHFACGLGRYQQHADAYIFIPDDHGVIAVEIGHMRPDNKWSNILAQKDGRPIRVLRVGFDRSVSMIRPQFTEPEIALFKLIQSGLDRRPERAKQEAAELLHVPYAER